MNARFVKKTVKLDYATLNALIKFYEDKREITVCPKGRKSKKVLLKGAIAVGGFK